MEQPSTFRSMANVGFHLVSLLAAFMTMFAIIVANTNDPSAGNEPMNDYFVTHRAVAEKLCDGPVLRAGPKMFFHRTVVMRLDGSAELMETSEVHRRYKTKTRADQVWPVAVCASHHS